MDRAKVQALAATPRTPSPELVALIGNPSTAYRVGCGAVALGALAIVGSGIAGFEAPQARNLSSSARSPCTAQRCM